MILLRQEQQGEVRKTQKETDASHEKEVTCAEYVIRTHIHGAQVSC